MRNGLRTVSFILVLAGWGGLVLSGKPVTDAAMGSHTGAVPKPYYLTGNEAAWSAFPKKPGFGSQADQADLAITLSIQASRTDEQKDEAVRDKDYKIELVTSVIDSDFKTKHPATYQVLKNADQDAYAITSKLKDANARPRPYAQHPTLVLALFPVRGFSYPSGHASGSELQARILAELFPSREKDLQTRARQVADSRVVAGVHYASDTEFGAILGDEIFSELKKKSRFNHDLADAAAQDHIVRQ